MTTSTKFEAIVYFLGSGKNGKSLLAKIWQAIIGRDNYSAVPLTELERSNNRAELEHKLLNVSGEVDPNSMLPTHILKLIASGDPLQADRKYGQPFKFIPTSTLLSCANSLPYIRDLTFGFERKFYIIKFNNRVTDEQEDKNLFNKLVLELDGIASLALAYYRQAVTRGILTTPSSLIRDREQLQLAANQVALFIKEGCVVNVSGGSESITDLFEAFLQWRPTEGCRGTFRRHTFDERLKDLSLNIVKRGNVERVKNINIKPEFRQKFRM